jgi:hypothetical protein
MTFFLIKKLDPPNNAGHRIIISSLFGISCICFIMASSIGLRYATPLDFARTVNNTTYTVIPNNTTGYILIK